MNVSKKLWAPLAAVTMFTLVSTAAATPITLQPSGAVATSDKTSELSLNEIKGILNLSFDLNLFYKANVGDEDNTAVVEEGSFSDAYTTEFGFVNGDDPLDPGSAKLTYDGGGPIVCPECFLKVKDGNQLPNHYIFNLGDLGWDGEMTLELSSFWPQQGAISNVAIYGGNSGDTPPPGTGQDIPLPGTLPLLGLGLFGLGVLARRRST